MIRSAEITAIVAVALLLGVTHLAAYRMGADRQIARHAAALAKVEASLAAVSATARAATAALLAERDRAARLALEIEDAARQDPDADRPALGSASVRRLEDRWRRD